MKDNFIGDMAKSIMVIQKQSWDAGYKVGYSKGYLEGLDKVRKIADKIFEPSKN